MINTISLREVIAVKKKKRPKVEATCIEDKCVLQAVAL